MQNRSFFSMSVFLDFKMDEHWTEITAMLKRRVEKLSTVTQHINFERFIAFQSWHS